MKLSRQETIDLLRLVGVTVGTLAEVAVRGGVDGDDDRGVYDDYLHSVTSEEFKVWRHNTNPSASYKRGLAELVPGLWTFVKGDHNITRPARRHAAFRQPDNFPFVVSRDGVGTDTGWFAINHHRGGTNGTSSLGCQTNAPGVWADYQPWAYKALGANNTKRYLLITASQVAKVLGGSHVPKLRPDRALWLAEKGSDAPPPVPTLASKALWMIQGPDKDPYPGIIKVVAGRPIVRTRLAARWLDAFDPRDLEASLLWDEDTLTLAGKRVDEVTSDANGDTWAPLRELTDAAGFGLTIAGNAITVGKG
jgi:hypothetical protein